MEYPCLQVSSKAKSSLSLYLLPRRRLSRVLMMRTSPLNKVRIFIVFLEYSNGMLLPLSLAAQLIGQDLYNKISSTALQLYKAAAQYAESRGVILADTKFEFGLLLPPSTSSSDQKQLILIDEVLTPDSSRYWPLKGYEPGRSQPSFDKQYVRDWLVGSGFRKGLEGGPEGREDEGWTIDEDVVQGTRARYQEAVDLLTK